MPGSTATLTLCAAALRYRASRCHGQGGEDAVIFPLRDTTGLFDESIVAAWIGAEAVDFLNQHSAELTAGRCVDIEIHHIRYFNGELRARVKACALAPLAPSWVKHQRASDSIQEQQSA